MDLRHLLGLLGLLVTANGQATIPLPAATAESLPAGAGIIGVRSYAGIARKNAGGVAAGSVTDAIPNFRECLRRCINVNTGVIPSTKPPACSSVTFISNSNTDNCIRHATCDITGANYDANTNAVHYIITNLCENNRVFPYGAMAIDTTKLPTTGALAITTVTATFDKINCEFQCNIDSLCVAADHNSNLIANNCRRFRRGSSFKSLDQCLPTVATTGFTAVQAACSNSATFNGGAFQGAVDAAPAPVAETAVALTYLDCLNNCNLNANCIGIKYNLVAALTGTTTGTVCQYYLKENIVNPLLCAPVTTNIYDVTVLKSQCPYIISTNMQQVQGVPQFNYRTLYKCKIECQYHPMCTGFDFNKLPNTRDRERCWFHFANEAGCEPLRRATDNCCDHWQIRNSRCSTNTDNYYEFVNSRITTGGTTAANTVNTYALCLKACNDDALCMGFDFNSASSTCKTHKVDTVCTAMTEDTSSIHYRKKSYECMFKFKNSKKSGGTAQAAVSVVGQCERACRQTTNCQGFDFDPMGRIPGRMCYLHLTGTICNPLLKAASLMHYRMRTRTCKDETTAPNILATTNWGNVQQNLHTLGNRNIGIMDSAIECLRQCKGTEGCAGIEYERNTGKCYTVTRTRACGTGIALDFVDRILLPNGCNAPVVTGYSGTADQHRLGGRLARSNTNRKTCAGLCSADPECLGFDFDKVKNQCWTQSSTQECRSRMQVFSNGCCDHYVNSSFSCSNYRPPTFTGYVTHDMRHVMGGKRESASLRLVTPQLCVNRCKAVSGCISVDFNFERNECYTHKKDSACTTEFINANSMRIIKKGNCGV